MAWDALKGNYRSGDAGTKRDLWPCLREDTRVGSYYNPIVLSDDGDYESDIDSYTSLEVNMHRILRVGMPDSDDEEHVAHCAPGDQMSNLAFAIIGSSTEDFSDSILPDSKPICCVVNSSTQFANSIVSNSKSIGKKTYVVEFEEGSESELLQKQVKSDEEAFELYNEYAFKFGFGVRKGHKLYSKVDYRTGCRAYVQFHVDEDGVYTLVAHVMGHNHAMVPLHERHYIRSHKLVRSEQLAFILNLKRSGIPVADAIRVMRKEVGGSPNLGFIASDAYNALVGEKVKSIDFSDSNQLIKFFAQRDGRMKRDYLIFGDVVIHDTTYRTNKYELICALFVGMNHHTNNIMFGCAFLLNEKTDSFVWLFDSFVRSMGGKKPITMMTDQCAAMAAALKVVLPSVNHRLCTWHIGQNSKKNIPDLRAQDDFVDVFNTVLKYSDTIAEFKFYWQRMIQFNCSTKKWLNDLYELREKWCSAYSKKFFSGGILSLQRSETTNKSVKRRLCKTHDLCDFYNLFLDVIGEWRSKENGQDFQCNKGNRHLAFAHLKLLEHASQIYTTEVYKIFEDEFIKGTECGQKVFFRQHPIVIYHIGRPDVDLIMHQVGYNEVTHHIECTCNYYSEVGVLCFHSLRVYHLHCVDKIPDQYILARWTRSVMCSKVEERKARDSDSVSSSVWRAQITRNFVRLITASQSDPNARYALDFAFTSTKEKVESIIGKVGEALVVEDVESVGGVKVGNPNQRPKYQSNSRPKSIIEKKCNQAKGWRKKAVVNALKVKNIAQTAIKMSVPAGSNIVHPSTGSQLNQCGVDEYFGVTITTTANL
ncbi:protein FAR1-RELATED SEQUENCE 5-like [Beta vulgaris subsp. vulgaris]|uniref:protein FAR1-RELATED SEQUENCE 5-like n=1 Tax=Beta vulgaris subsp. vulgaris TaxID=3555 RepID=UPI00203740E5|nr:protein FAR1-RELATED SEQUENCE 5-like [Beta vulgaris subsp. vulgaris]